MVDIIAAVIDYWSPMKTNVQCRITFGSTKSLILVSCCYRIFARFLWDNTWKFSFFPARDEDEGATSSKYRPRRDDYEPTAFKLVPGNSYATCILPVRLLYRFSILLSFLWWWCLDSLIASFIHTTEEGSNIQKVSLSLKVFFLAISLLLLTPFALIALMIWLPLQLIRPRSYSFYSATEDFNERQHLLFSDVTPYRQMSTTSDVIDVADRMSREIKTTSFAKKSYTLISGNVCLMPEFLARMNNVSNSLKRAEKISNLLCGNQTIVSKFENCSMANPGKLLDTEMLMKTASEMSVNGLRFGSESLEDEVISLDSNSESSFQWSVSSKERAVCENFPKSSDFLCLQEVFDRRATDMLLKGLRAKHPYILYDVISPFHHGRVSLLNSGLCIASKYPFLGVEFKAFPDGYREDKLACKGLLMTKVFLGESDDGKCHVGFVATTHLQAITHTKASEVRCKQLKLIQRWLEDFKKSTSNRNHITVFDIICGDFNFDQESHFEENERKCEFRRIYRDPCMNEITGQQHSWVVGTELKADLIHDNAVNSSRGLQRMLISELERPRYVASTLPANCAMTKMSDGKRRIDYILYRPCENKKMVVRDFKFITGFATLTDHIPIGMVFTVED